MDQKQIAQQMIEFNKTAFDNTFGAMVALQDQTETIFSGFVKKTPWFPEEGEKAFNNWANTCKKGSEDFKKVADEGYKKITDYFI